MSTNEQHRAAVRQFKAAPVDKVRVGPLDDMQRLPAGERAEGDPVEPGVADTGDDDVRTQFGDEVVPERHPTRGEVASDLVWE